MPGGHASHKGKSAKPNTNAEGQLDLATDPPTEAESMVPKGEDAVRARKAPENEAATQRAEQNKQ